MSNTCELTLIGDKLERVAVALEKLAAKGNKPTPLEKHRVDVAAKLTAKMNAISDFIAKDIGEDQ